MKHWFWILSTLAFLMPVTLTASDTNFGRPLPADGSAPFAAYQMRLQAIHSADWEAYKHSAPLDEVDAQIAEAGGEAAAAAKFPEFAKFLSTVTPISAKFVEGRADDRRAVIWVSVTIMTQGAGEMVVDRNVEMRFADGRWLLENEGPR